MKTGVIPSPERESSPQTTLSSPDGMHVTDKAGRTSVVAAGEVHTSTLVQPVQ
jgi:hypothetical protein